MTTKINKLEQLGLIKDESKTLVSAASKQSSISVEYNVSEPYKEETKIVQSASKQCFVCNDYDDIYNDGSLSESLVLVDYWNWPANTTMDTVINPRIFHSNDRKHNNDRKKALYKSPYDDGCDYWTRTSPIYYSDSQQFLPKTEQQKYWDENLYDTMTPSVDYWYLP